MSLKAKLEAIIYAAEEPVTLDQLLPMVKEDLLAIQSGEDLAGRQEPSSQGEQAAKKEEKAEQRALKEKLHVEIEQLMHDYATAERGMEIRQVAGGYRMSTKPEHHDLIRAFAKGIKAPVRLSLQALETLAVIAYKQPVTAPEISEIRGVDCTAVLAGLLDRKLITTAGRKPVIGRPILYKTTKDFLLRFGLSDIAELPSMEEFEKISSSGQAELFSDARDTAIADATGVPDDPRELPSGQQSTTETTLHPSTEASLHTTESA